MKNIKIILLLAPFFLMTQTGYTQNSTYCKGPVIIMEAEGVVESIPDIAIFDLNLSSRGEDATSALTKLNSNIQKTLDILTKLNIPNDDIKSDSVEISAIWHYPDNDTEESKIIGYAGYGHISAKVRNFTDISDIVSQMMASSDSLVNQIEYSSSSIKNLENQARKMAYEEVAQKARLYAELSGNTLGQACTISESDIDTISEKFQIYGASYFNENWKEHGKEHDVITVVGSRVTPIPIMPGKIQTKANVTIVYQLEN